VVAHNECFSPTVLHGFALELERPAIEPTRPGILVIVEAEPGMGKLAHLRVALAPPQIDDLGYPEGAKSFDVVPGLYRATER
jgi:hypothetical protein